MVVSGVEHGKLTGRQRTEDPALVIDVLWSTLTLMFLLLYTCYTVVDWTLRHWP